MWWRRCTSPLVWSTLVATAVSESWLRRLQLWGTLAAAALVVVAFWRPEQDWLDADRSFAWYQAGDRVVGERHPGGRP